MRRPPGSAAAVQPAPASAPAPINAPDAADAYPAPAGTPVGPDSRWALGATYAVLVLLGAELGAVGSFLVPLRVGAVLFPLSIGIAVIGNAVAGSFAARITGSRAGAMMPGLGWLLVVGLLSSARPEGDVVVTGGLVGLGFTVGGALAAAAAVGWSPRPASPAPGVRR